MDKIDTNGACIVAYAPGIFVFSEDMSPVGVIGDDRGGRLLAFGWHGPLYKIRRAVLMQGLVATIVTFVSVYKSQSETRSIRKDLSAFEASLFGMIADRRSEVIAHG